MMNKKILYIGLGLIGFSLLLAKGKAAANAAYNLFNNYLGNKALERSIRTANPLSIKTSSRQYLGAVGNDNTQIIFENVVYGLAAGISHIIARYIMGKLHGGIHGKLNTISKILYVWAPPSDNNDTEAYIKFVTEKSGYNRNYIINTGDYTAIKKITRAMAIFENGGQYGKEGNIFSESNWEGLFAAAWPIAQKQI